MRPFPTAGIVGQPPACRCPTDWPSRSAYAPSPPMAAGDTITVCAIVKDERPYLIEWVAYYRLLGFDRMIFYNNDSSDGTGRLLDAMAEMGLVEHRLWPSRV